MCTPMKPFKYDIKLMFLTDSHNNFLINAYFYPEENSYENNLSDRKKTIVELSRIL